MKKLGVIFINLGSPKSTSREDVSEFLRSLLMDKYVIRLPFWFRYLLVNKIIIPRRVSRSVNFYKSVWGNDGSPLIVNSHNFTHDVKARLKEKNEDNIAVVYAMCHCQPSVESGVAELKEQGVTDVLAIPMFPHFEKSTYLRSVELVEKSVKAHNLKVSYIPPFYNHGDYLAALDITIKSALSGVTIDKLIVSYHALPVDYMPCGKRRARACIASNNLEPIYNVCKDCYHFNCNQATNLIAQRVGAESDDVITTYQSQMGHKEWLSPVLHNVVAALPSSGAKNIAVISPTFIADCLETIKDVDSEARTLFMQQGGENFHYIPALNNSKIWVKKVTKWIVEYNKNLTPKLDK